jgi:hypothetical protein
MTRSSSPRHGDLRGGDNEVRQDVRLADVPSSGQVRGGDYWALGYGAHASLMGAGPTSRVPEGGLFSGLRGGRYPPLVAFGVANPVLALSVVFIPRRVEDICPCCACPVVMGVDVGDVDDDAAARCASPARGQEAAAFIRSVEPNAPRSRSDFGVDDSPVGPRFHPSRYEYKNHH